MNISDTLTTFSSDEFGQIRLVQGEDGEPRFCLADICKPLGLSVKGVKQRLCEGVISNYPLQTAGGKQAMTFVNDTLKDHGILPTMERA